MTLTVEPAALQMWRKDGGHMYKRLEVMRQDFYVMAHFHRRVRVSSVCKGAARVVLPPLRVAVLVSQCSSVEVLR